MPNVAASIYHDLISPKMDPPAWALDGRNWLLIFLLVLASLCFLRQLNSLRHTSYIGLFAASELMELYVGHKLTCLCSLLGYDCYYLLFSTHRWYASPWGDPPRSFYP